MTTMLFDPERHEPLHNKAWEDNAAIEAIRDIVEATITAFDPATFWPVHPIEDGADFIKPHTLKGLYFGASGVLWALHYLQRQKIVSIPIDLTATIQHVYAEFMRYPDSKSDAPGLMVGEAGVLLLMRVIEPHPWIDDRLYEVIERNIENEAVELFWGAPGTMLAALWMYRWTKEDRWKQLYVRNAHFLIGSWNSEVHPDVFVWTQQLYGKSRQYLGAGHGFAGNVGALLRGLDLLNYETRQEICRRSAAVIKHFAVTHDAMTNWLPLTTSDADSFRVHWCHGAPGLISELGNFPENVDSEIEILLLQAVELVWHAGPLKKGCCPCHGTDGNAMTFLQLYKRTGNEKWLQHARSFGMHAISQYCEKKEKWKMGHYALWTGDLGLAVNLSRVLQARAGYLCLDYL